MELGHKSTLALWETDYTNAPYRLLEAVNILRQFLLVDDSAISRVMLKSLIEDNFSDVSITEVATAEQAIEQCDSGNFDAIFLDLNMPGQDGLSVAPKLRELCPDASIALLTANFQERVKLKAEEAGLQFYAKPITLEIVQDFMANRGDN